MIPVLPLAITGASIGVGCLSSTVISKIGFNAIHHKLINRAMYHKQFADRIYELHKKVMKDGNFSEEEYEKFLKVKGYNVPKTNEINSIFSQEEIKEINEEIQSKMKEKLINKTIKKGRFL